MARLNRLARVVVAGAVDRSKQRLKRSAWLRSMPLLQYSYLLEIPRAIVLPELKLAYVPIAKVANRSMKAAIAAHIGLPYQGHPNRAAWQYLPVAALPAEDYFRFAFVRNPLDRLLSCYAQKIVLYGRRMKLPLEFWRYGNRFHRDMTFADFVETVAGIPDRLSDIHFRSQHTFLYHRGQLMVDFIGRFERLAQDWDQLRQRYSLGPLPHENRSPHDEPEGTYTPELATLAAQRYARDIELLGYENQVAPLLRL